MVRNNVKVEINKEIAEIVDKYIAVVKENYDAVAIILFGSYAKGTEHKDSDIDIAVITDDIKTEIGWRWGVWKDIREECMVENYGLK